MTPIEIKRLRWNEEERGGEERERDGRDAIDVRGAETAGKVNPLKKALPCYDRHNDPHIIKNK